MTVRTQGETTAGDGADDDASVRIEAQAELAEAQAAEEDLPELEEPTGEDPWRILKRQQDRRRYVRMLVPRRPGREKAKRPDPAVGVRRDAHPLLGAPATMTRSGGTHPEPADVRAYMRHSADVAMHGGTASAVTYPSAVCSLAEHYLFRRIGGSSAGAMIAAATAAAELGRGAPDGEAPEPGSLTVVPGYAGLAAATAWLAGGPQAPEDEDRADHWRLPRMVQPSPLTRPLFRVATVVLRTSSERPLRLARRASLAALSASGSRGRGVVLGVWGALLMAWLLTTFALSRAAVGTSFPGVLVGLGSALLLALAVAGGLATAAAVAVGSVLRLVVRQADGEHFGVVPGVGVEKSARTPLSTRLDAWAGVPVGEEAVPALFDWLTDRIDDLAGAPRGESRRPLTFGDLWLGRSGAELAEDPSGAEARLRRAARDPESRVVDLSLHTTDIAQRRPFRLPFRSVADSESDTGGRFFFCPDCLRGVVPARVVAHMVAKAPARDVENPCRRHGDESYELHELPEPWDLPVAFATRLSFAPPGLMRAVPLVAVEQVDPADEELTLRAQVHWFVDGSIGSASSVADFDALLPRWPTFGLSVARAGRPGEEAVRVPAMDATGRVRSWRGVIGLRGFVGAVLDTSLGWRDAVQAEAPGYRGRIAEVRRVAADGPSFYLSEAAVLRSVVRGYAAGESLRERFTGSDDAVPGQTQTDRYRWIRMRMALREYRALSMEISARMPLYNSLASRYHVPGPLTDWFDPPLAAASRDPLGADAAAIVTTLRTMSTGGVLSIDVEHGAPPPSARLRLTPED